MCLSNVIVISQFHAEPPVGRSMSEIRIFYQLPFAALLMPRLARIDGDDWQTGSDVNIRGQFSGYVGLYVISFPRFSRTAQRAVCIEVEPRRYSQACSCRSLKRPLLERGLQRVAKHRMCRDNRHRTDGSVCLDGNFGDGSSLYSRQPSRGWICGGDEMAYRNWYGTAYCLSACSNGQQHNRDEMITRHILFLAPGLKWVFPSNYRAR